MSTTATQLQRVKASEGRDAILRALSDDGAVIIKGLFTNDHVKSLPEEVPPALPLIGAG